MNARMLGRATLGCVVFAGMATGATSAPAATIAMEGSTLVYRGAGTEENQVGLDIEPGGTRLAITETGAGVTITSYPGGCEEIGVDPGVYCPVPAAVRVEGGDGDDRIEQYEPPGGIALTFLGGAGTDYLKFSFDHGASRTADGGDGNDDVRGGEGADTLLGGIGDDKVHGFGAADDVKGGEGNDEVSGDLNGGQSADVVDGGGGFDRLLEYTEATAVNLSMDGVADDGRPGENDNLTSIEDVQAFGEGTYKLTDGDDKWLSARGTGTRTAYGLGGTDRLDGSTGIEILDGGAGDDHVEGGFGDDTLTGGPGRDKIYGDETGPQCDGAAGCPVPVGNDVINARDGEIDSIDCGVGNDRAVVDADDVVTLCETVERPAGTTTGGGGGAGGETPGGQTGGTQSKCSKLPKVKGLKLAKARRKLKAAGCAVKTRKARSRRIKKGRVIRAKRSGTTVTVFVSRGR